MRSQFLLGTCLVITLAKRRKFEVSYELTPYSVAKNYVSAVSLHPGDEQAGNRTLRPVLPAVVSPSLQRHVRHPTELHNLTVEGHGQQALSPSVHIVQQPSRLSGFPGGRRVVANASSMMELAEDRRQPSASEDQDERHPPRVLDRAKTQRTKGNAPESFRDRYEMPIWLHFLIALVFICGVVALSLTCSVPFVTKDMFLRIFQRITDGIRSATSTMWGQRTQSTPKKNGQARLESDSFDSGSDAGSSDTDTDTEAAEFEKDAVLCGCLWKFQEKDESIVPLSMWETWIPTQNDLSHIVEWPRRAADLDLWRERYFILSLSSDGLTLSYRPSRKDKRMKSYSLGPLEGTNKLAVLLPSAKPFVSRKVDETDHTQVPDVFYSLLLKGALKDVDGVKAGKEEYIVLAAATENEFSAWISIFDSCARDEQESSSSSDAMKLKHTGSENSTQAGADRTESIESF